VSEHDRARWSPIRRGYAPVVSTRSLLTFLGHSTVLLDLSGVRLLTDPLLTDRLGILHRHSRSLRDAFGDLGVDAVLISHAHHDHLHLPSLRLVPGRPQIVLPRGLRALMPSGREIHEVDPGQGVSIGAVRVTALAARHQVRRHPFAPLSPALGFLVASESTRIYFAGDTDLFPEMSDLAGKVDVALLPVWGWGPRLGVGHLDPERAAEAVRRIRPRVAIPIHWGTSYPWALARIWPRPLAHPPLEFARQVELRAPDVDVRVLAPGEALELPS